MHWRDRVAKSRPVRKRVSRPIQNAALILVIAVVVPLRAQAGPCTAEIDRLQAQVDAAIDASAGAGGTGKESTGALLHHEPTPGSIARAEESLGGGPAGERALAALGQAREADRLGDAAACEQALTIARNAIGR